MTQWRLEMLKRFDAVELFVLQPLSSVHNKKGLNQNEMFFSAIRLELIV